jgi:putative transposase
MLARTFGCVRLVWNQILAARHLLYRAEGKSLSYAASDATLTALKRDPEFAFLSEVSSVPLQQALRHQHKAFGAFFAGRARYPRFKSRRGRQSATYTRSAFSMRGGMLRLAKTNAALRYVWTWPDIDPGSLDPTSVTVAKDPAGRWFVTFHVDAPDPVPIPATRQQVGLDLGLTDLAVLSTGEKIPHPKDWERHEKRLERYQRRLARCQKGSRLARAIACTGWAQFRSMLEYKAGRCGRTVVAVDRWYPTSKTCSACGHLLAVLSLGTRHWACPACGTRHDRDINAAKNILAAGLAAGTGDGADACGGTVRRAGATRTLVPVKQEPPGVSPGLSVL